MSNYLRGLRRVRHGSMRAPLLPVIGQRAAGRRQSVRLVVVASLLMTMLALGDATAGQPEAGRAGAVTVAPAVRPNIVVVMADDMRVGDMRFAPNLRRLVGRQGLTFRNSFSPYPLCCPARASFLTGTYAHNHRVWWHDPPFGYRVFDDSRTLATALSAAGYRTGLVGKYVNGYGVMRSRVADRPSARYVPRGWSQWRASLDNGTPGVHGGTVAYDDIAFNVNGRIDNSHHGEYSSDVIGNFSVATAEQFARSARPFFLFVNHVAPHFGGPREPDDPPAFAPDSTGHLQEFRTPARPAWVRGRYNHVITRGAGLPRDGGPAEHDVSDKPPRVQVMPEPSAQERRWMREVTRQRAEAVFLMDRQIKRLIDRLKRDGEWANTVFMFTSDNGYFLGEHRFRAGKVFAYEPSLRVPFLVTGPGMRSGTDRFDPITTIDVAATILDLANARPPRRADGISKLPTIRRGDQGWSTAMVTESALPGERQPAPGFDDRRSAIGIRTARYSLIVNRSGADELYDLAVDPLQNHNAYRDRSYRPIRGALLEVWDQMRNCRGSECRIALSDELNATATQERTLTLRYWRAIDAEYGWR